MTGISADLLNAYINANILFGIGFLLWFGARAALRFLGFHHEFEIQLRLLNWVFLTIALSPLFVLGFGLLLNAGLVAPRYSLNLSDFVVAHYLDGEFRMKPSDFESYLGVRFRLTSDILTMNGPIAALIVAAFAGGFAFFTARLGLSLWRLNAIVGGSYLWRRFGTVELRVADTITVPFSARLMTRRVVIIPSGMLRDTEDLRMVLGHELQHLRQGDIEWELVLEFLKPLFFWNPAFVIWKRQVERLRELSCDRRVLARRGYDARAYCNCLLRVSADRLRAPRLFAVAMPYVALVQIERRSITGKSGRLLLGRVESMFQSQVRRFPGAAFVLLVVPVLVLTLLASVAIQRPGDWSQDRLMLSTIVNLERLADRTNRPAGF